MELNKSPRQHVHNAQSSEYVECKLNLLEESNHNKEKKETDHDNNCRVCLGIGCIPIFGSESSPDISNDIETFGSIKVEKHDNFPKYICESCESLLRTAVLFRKTAKQSDLLLKSNHHNKKNTSNNISDIVKLEVGIGIDNGNSNVDIGIGNSPIKIKEEITSEPFIFEDKDLDDSTNSEENVGQLLHIVNNSPDSLLEIKNDYDCKTCDISLNTSKEYSQHKKSAQHKKSRYSNKMKCEICLKNITRAYYSRHMETHSNNGKDDKLQCPICNKSYSKTYFNFHLTHAHNKVNKKTQSERIECPICNKSYEKQYYKFHLAIHNNDASKYICDTCGKSFIQQSAFKRHRLIHDSELAFKCNLCPYRGRHPGLVKTHMQTHTRDYQHRCMECPAKFLTKSNLNKHLQRHKGPVDFKCETCKRGFYSKIELERHYEADHLGVKKHICNICGKAFGYRNAMMSHQLKVHKREKLTNGKGRLPLYLEADKKNVG